MKHQSRDRDRRPLPTSELEALGFAVTPILPPPFEPSRTDELPDWPSRDPSSLEFGSVVLRWITVILVLGLVALALATPSVNGVHQETPAYPTD